MVGTCTTVPSDATPISAFARSTRADGMVSAAVGAIFAPLIHSTPAQGQQTCQLVRHQTRLLANSDHNDNNNDHNDNDITMIMMITMMMIRSCQDSLIKLGLPACQASAWEPIMVSSPTQTNTDTASAPAKSSGLSTRAGKWLRSSAWGAHQYCALRTRAKPRAVLLRCSPKSGRTRRQWIT